MHDPTRVRRDGCLRRHSRIPVRLWADVYWEGSDRQIHFARAQVLDVSESGMRLKLAGNHPATGLSVNVRIEQYCFSEFGIVRHDVWHGVLGIELRFEMAARNQVDRWQRIVRSAPGPEGRPA